MSEEIKDLKNKLFYENENGAMKADKAVLDAANEYCKGYMAYLDAAKTEREAVKEGIKMAKAEGFVPYAFGDKIEKGGKYYYDNRGKALYLFTVGSLPTVKR